MKTNTTVLLTSLVLGGAVLSSNEVTHATTYQNDLNATTTTKVSFEDGGGQTIIVDPIDPGEIIEPIDPINPGKGALRITYASKMAFGKQKIASNSEYYAGVDSTFKDSKGLPITVPNIVAVQDARLNASGYTLSVSQKAQFTDGKDSLTGAQLSLNNVTQANATNGVTVSNSVINLTPNGAAVNVVSAPNGKGSGSTTISFGKDVTEGSKSVKLTVPSSTKKSALEYSSDLNWTLAATPI